MIDCDHQTNCLDISYALSGFYRMLQVAAIWVIIIKRGPTNNSHKFFSDSLMTPDSLSMYRVEIWFTIFFVI